MATLKGPGAMTGVNLVVKAYKNAATEDGKTRFLDAQIDARDSRGPGQTNLHLVSEKQTTAEGKAVYNNGAAYAAKQFEAMVSAAGDNVTPLLNASGEEIGTVYGVKANLMPSNRGRGLIFNSTTLEPSEFEIDAKTLDRQFETMREAKQTQAKAKSEAQAQAAPAPEAQAETEQLSLESEGLEVG